MTTAALYKWQFGNTKLHCPTCFDLNGQIHPLDAWQNTIMPGFHAHCNCRLVPTTDARSIIYPPVQLVPGLGRTTESRPVASPKPTYYDAATGMRVNGQVLLNKLAFTPSPFTAPAIAAFRAEERGDPIITERALSVPRPAPTVTERALDIPKPAPAPATAAFTAPAVAEQRREERGDPQPQPPPPQNHVVYNERAAVQAPVPAPTPAPSRPVPPPQTPARSAGRRYIAI